MRGVIGWRQKAWCFSLTWIKHLCVCGTALHFFRTLTQKQCLNTENEGNRISLFCSPASRTSQSSIILNVCLTCRDFARTGLHAEKSKCEPCSLELLSTWNWSVFFGFTCRSACTGVSCGAEPGCVTGPQWGRFLPDLCAVPQKGGHSWAGEAWRMTDVSLPQRLQAYRPSNNWPELSTSRCWQQMFGRLHSHKQHMIFHRPYFLFSSWYCQV